MKNINKFGILLVVLVLSMTLVACGESSTTPDRNKPAFPTIAPNPKAAKLPAGTVGPVVGAKVILPLDEAPHNDITEWWYYTGHLNTTDGRKYGFEFVIFQSNQSDYPTGYASHFAITDLNSSKFTIDQKLQLASQPVKFGGTAGVNLNIYDWKLQALSGTDHIQAKMSDGSYAIDLNLKDQKGVALHGGGEFSYGAAGASYYYSRPRMSVNGTLSVNGQAAQVTGQVWFDHQWGNFMPLGDGGWQWFSTQLSNGSEMMLYYLLDAKNNLLQAFGSYMPPCDATNPCDPTTDQPIKAIELGGSDFEIKPTSQWTSPNLGITYPGSWHVTVKAKTGVPNLDLDYKPRLANQELDTRKSTGQIYWEGDTAITGTANGQPISGDGYVELTGFGKK